LTGELKVRAIEAKDIVAKDTNGKSDPYLALRVDGKTFSKTKVKPKTLNPVWNEDLGASVSKAKKIDLIVYDKDVMLDEVCGLVSLKSTDISSEEVDVWLDLKPKGRLHVSYCFKPTWTEAAVSVLSGMFSFSSSSHSSSLPISSLPSFFLLPPSFSSTFFNSLTLSSLFF
jgi:Ca2+-dependent lipid-binding protein